MKENPFNRSKETVLGVENISGPCVTCRPFTPALDHASSSKEKNPPLKKIEVGCYMGQCCKGFLESVCSSRVGDGVRNGETETNGLRGE